MIQSAAMALLCLSTGHLAPFSHWCKLNFFGDEPCISLIRSHLFLAGTIGALCLSLTLQSSFASWMKQSQSRHVTIKETTAIVPTNDALPDPIQHPSPVQKTMAVFNVSDLTKNSKEQQNEFDNAAFCSQQEEESSNPMARRVSLPAKWIDGRADKVYTVGCFDLFHDGHRILLQRMRQLGREVIVGVHDSRSIHKLKSRVPVDGTEARMINVRRHADQVYCVAGTDPSNFISSIVHLREGETAIYIRGDDMADFPSRHVVESLMPVQFLPYTTGVSSTQIRKDLYSHIRSDDVEHLEKIN
jgi:cytidyltransferase-like protein